MLWERVPTEQAVALMAGRATDETRRMLLGGVEIVARYSTGDGGERGKAMGRPAPGPPQTWLRIAVAPGIELHLRDGTTRLRPGEVEGLLAAIAAVLRRGAG